MVSITNNIGSTLPLGDMQNALRQATEALEGMGFAYTSPIAYAGPSLGDVPPNVQQWMEEKQFNAQKSEALEAIKSRNVAGSNAGILELIAQVERSQTPAQLQAAMNAIERILSSAERLFSEMNDPETKEQINARREFMYNNDAEYRAATDKIASEAKTTNEKLDAATQAMDAELKAKGITAAQDKELAELDEKIKSAKPWEMADLLKQKQALVAQKFEENKGHLSPEVQNEAGRSIEEARKEADVLVAQQEKADKEGKERQIRGVTPAFANDAPNQKSPVNQEMIEMSVPSSSLSRFRGFGNTNITGGEEAETIVAQNVQDKRTASTNGVVLQG